MANHIGTFSSRSYDYYIFLYCIAADLTIRVLYTLTLILKDHKAQPAVDKLITFIPVSHLITL